MASQASSVLHPSVTSSLNYLLDRWNQKLPATQAQSSSEDSNHTVYSILVGTNNGIGLARCYGGQYDDQPPPSLSEDVLSTVEGYWTTLVSNESAGRYLAPIVGSIGTGASNNDGGNHGGVVRTVVACYEALSIVHVHLPPLVVTILASPTANLGAIRSAIPAIRQALEPLRRALDDVTSSQGGGGGGNTEETQAQGPTALGVVGVGVGVGGGLRRAR